MNGLNSKARALLKATERADEPSQDDFDRVHAGVASTLALGASAGVAATTVARTAVAVGHGVRTAATASGGALMTGSMAPPVVATATFSVVKVVVAFVAVIATVGVGAGSVITARRRAHQATVPTPVLTSPAERIEILGGAPSPPPVLVPRAAPAASTERAPLAPPRVDPEKPAARPVPPSNTARKAALALRAPASSSEAPSPRSSSVEAEVATLGQARAALNRNDVTGAVLLLDDYVRRFPGGSMAEDHDALEVFARCAAGEPERARGLAGQFFLRYPASPHVSAVRDACKAEPTP